MPDNGSLLHDATSPQGHTLKSFLILILVLSFTLWMDRVHFDVGWMFVFYSSL